jgi:hypothetical protein
LVVNDADDGHAFAGYLGQQELASFVEIAVAAWQDLM